MSPPLAAPLAVALLLVASGAHAAGGPRRTELGLRGAYPAATDGSLLHLWPTLGLRAAISW